MTDIEHFSNHTARFLLSSSWDGESNDMFRRQLLEAARELEKEPDKTKRKAILDDSLRAMLETYGRVLKTFRNVACFICLSYRREDLYKLDLEGLDFRDDNEAFEYWARHFLSQIGADQPMISKTIHYLRVNTDLELIEKIGFEKAWVISKYQRLLSEHRVEIPEDVILLAEDSEFTVQALTERLDWEYERRQKITAFLRENGEAPSIDMVEEWKKDHALKREKRARSHRKKHVPDPVHERLQNSLSGMTKGDIREISKFYHTLFEDLLPNHMDVGEQIYEFMHKHCTTCAISGKPLGPYNPMESHHLQSRGSVTDRRILNLIPVAASVHKEIHNLGLTAVLEKYGATQELLISQAFKVLCEYIKWLESKC